MDRDTPSSHALPTQSGFDDQPAEPPIVEEILIEEISIDGMCGVY